jgi:hypothetical protein
MLSLLFAAATYWTVHIDFPSNQSEYERIDAQFNSTIRDFYMAHNMTPPAGWHIVTADGAYIGLRPRGTMMEAATPQLPPDLSKELQTKTAPISATTHNILRAHHSELWHLEADLTTTDVPKKYTVMRVDVVSPPHDDDYEKTMKELVKELSSNGIDTIGFFSSYGDGAYHYIFSSDKAFKVRSLKGFGTTHDFRITKFDTR